MGFKKKNLEIDTKSPELRSKLHSKKVSIADPSDFIIMSNLVETEEFKVSHIKKFAKTMKYSEQRIKEGGFNFDFSGIDEKQTSNDNPSKKESPKNLAGVSASGGTSFQLGFNKIVAG